MEQKRTAFPTDLVFVAGLGAFTVGTGYGWFGAVPGRSVLGLVAVLFAPGYALVAALFPRRNADGGFFENIRVEVTTTDGRVTAVERLVLAVGLSVALVPLVGLGLNYTPQGIEPATLLAVTGAGTVLFSAIAAVRRQRTLPRERFEPTVTGFLGNTARQLHAVRTGSVLTLFVIVGLLVAAGGIGVAVLDGDRGERFTEFYLLSGDESVADEYPEEIATGESDRVTVGITNQEGRSVDYSVVVQLQSVDRTGDIVQAETLDRFTVTVPPGETWEQAHTVSPQLTGEDLRITYLLYTGDPPEDTSYRPENAYRSAHFWVDVTPPGPS